jgi:hypothetical protein
VRGRKVFAGFLVGVLILQAAWLAAMPAFRGPDEFDHVFRAEGVSHGAFMPVDSISHDEARGPMTPARRSVIDAASAVCSSYTYTNYYDCHVYGDDKGDWGRVGSGAGAYNPAYYVVVGNIARFFDGVTVDYVIRAATAAICALLLAWAATLWVGIGRSRWRILAFMTALTPVLLYSTTIAAPNGVSCAAAVLLWVAGLALLNGDPDRSVPGAAIAAVVAAVVMCNTHTTGPLWLLLIVIAWLLLKPRDMLRILRDRRYWGMIAAIVAGAVASSAWTIASGANLPNASVSITSGPPEIGTLARYELLWLLQTIAAFPLRNEVAPPVVYALWLIGFIALLVKVVRGRGTGLVAVVWIVIAAIATQTILTYVGYRTEGYAWQGRYGLPLTVGLALIPGFVDIGRRTLYEPLYHCAILGIILATGLSVWHVANHERNFVLRPWTDYVSGGPIAAGVVAILGVAVMTWSLSHDYRAHDPQPDPRSAQPQDAPRSTKIVR